MEQKYLIDTNIIIDAQMKKIPEKGLAYLSKIINKDFCVSFITYIEFLGYKNITQASKDFIAFATIFDINKNIIDNCIELKKANRIKLPDAIIASTALVFGLTIITRNTQDFKNIIGLNIINPYEL